MAVNEKIIFQLSIHTQIVNGTTSSQTKDVRKCLEVSKIILNFSTSMPVYNRYSYHLN